MKSVNGLWMPALIKSVYKDICSKIVDPNDKTDFKQAIGPLLQDGACPFVKVNFVNLR